MCLFLLRSLLFVLPMVVATFAHSQSSAPPALYRERNCMACHAINSPVVGPAFVRVAERYKGNAQAPARLVEKVLRGGSGNWGAVPMPANLQVSPEEAQALVTWILGLK